MLVRILGLPFQAIALILWPFLIVDFLDSEDSHFEPKERCRSTRKKLASLLAASTLTGLTMFYTAFTFVHTGDSAPWLAILIALYAIEGVCFMNMLNKALELIEQHKKQI